MFAKKLSYEELERKELFASLAGGGDLGIVPEEEAAGSMQDDDDIIWEIKGPDIY